MTNPVIPCSSDILPQHDLDERKRLGRAWIEPANMAVLRTDMEAIERAAALIEALEYFPSESATRLRSVARVMARELERVGR